jgi:hypothetical protein
MAYNFQIGNNKVKLIMEYENVTKKSFIIRRINAALQIKLFELHFRIP